MSCCGLCYRFGRCCTEHAARSEVNPQDGGSCQKRESGARLRVRRLCSTVDS